MAIIKKMSIYIRIEVFDIKIMNEKQRHIFDWLQKVGPELAELYEGSVKMKEDASFSGRGRFICHAVREIRNRLPDEVSGKLEIKRLEYKDEVEGLAKAWEKEGLEGVYEKEGRGQNQQKVPRDVLVLVNLLIRKHRKVAYTNREKAKMLMVELEPENKALQVSLYPVADAWFRETEWFVDRAHVGKEIDKDDLVTHFQRFENVLYSLIGYFYEGMEDIERIIKNANAFKQTPSQNEVNEVVLRLVRARYRMYFFDKLENPLWLKPLKDKEFFKSPRHPKTGEVYERWPQGGYLKKMASKVPYEVLEIINAIKSKNPFVQKMCFDCLIEMPEDVAAQGIGVVENFLGERQYSGNWGLFWGGEQAAKLMVKLVEKHTKEAFEIAKVLLDVWRPGDDAQSSFETIRCKFRTHEYMELMFKCYIKVWEKRPFEAVRVLVDIYDGYLEVYNKKKDYDTSEYLGVSVEDLENIQRLEYDLNAIIMKAICEAGRVVIEKEPQKINELLDDLEKRNKGIFHRVEMYLLRFVPAGMEKNRINKLIRNQKFIENRLYRYEHRRLLNYKFEDVGEEAKKAFIEWVRKPKITEERKKEVEEWCQKNNEKLTDFEKWDNQIKAENLYLVREKFKEIYKEYKKAAEIKEDRSLAPRRMVSKAHAVSPEEGSPYSSEKMGQDNVEIVVDYLLEPKNYEGKEKVSGWGTAKDALASSFKSDFKKRHTEYLNIDLKKLELLDPEFLGKIFYSVSEVVREGSFKKDGWERLIDLACGIVENKNKEKEWKDCFLAILWVLHDGFGEESNRITFNETIIRKFWLILNELVRYNYDEKLESEEDPVQRRLRSVQGSAFGQIVLLGVVCKNDFATVFDNSLKKEMGQVYGFIVKEVKRSEVNCTFGLDFARIYWLDREWVESNLDSIFDKEMWDTVWGTYVSWDRPSPQCFKFLIEKGKYGQAVQKIGDKNKYKFGKEPDEGLVEHLMIGYFNGWIGLENEVLKLFFEKASAELRGKASRFLTTGFKSVNEEGGEEKEKVAKRMKQYWEKRLAEIKEKQEEGKDEAIELTGWVEDSVLPAKETLELLEQSLDLSDGKIGKMRDAKVFIEGVCELGQGNELLALKCLKKAASDENMHMPWADIQDPLVQFLESMVESPENIQSEAKEVADIYGRYNPDKFRLVWEKLRKFN